MAIKEKGELRLHADIGTQLGIAASNVSLGSMSNSTGLADPDSMSEFYAHKPIVTSGLVLHLDASNPVSYPGSGTTWTDLSGNNNHFTLYNSPTHVNQEAINFNGSNQYARSTSTLNLSSYSQITVEIGIKINTTSTPSGMAYEHSPNWNTNSMGFGLILNSNGSTIYVANSHHTNQYLGSTVYNYNGIVGTDITIHTNTWSNVSDSTGRLAYINGVERGVISGSTSTSSYPAFRNDYLYISSRAGTSIFANQQIYFIRIYNRKLSSAEILQNYNAVKDRFLIISDGLTLNLDAGNKQSYPGSGTTWTDLSSSGNNATLVNSPSFSPENKGSICINSTGPYVQLNVNSYGIVGLYTISFWVKRIGGTGVFLYVGQSGTTGMYFENYSNTDLFSWFFGPNSPQSVSWGNVLSTSEWTHVTMSVITSQKTVITYINGVVSGNPTVLANTITAPSGTQSWKIKNNTQSWTGCISQLLIYNKILTPPEVLQNYNATKDRYLPIVSDGLVFNLDAGQNISYPGTGNTWYDISGQGINGTLSNVTYSTQYGGVMDFNGTSSLVNMNNDFTSLVPPGVDGEYTLEAWIYVRTSQGTTTNADSIIGHTSDTGFGMQVGVSGGLPRMNYGARTTSNFYGTTFTYNTWNHIVLTRKADVTRCTTYVNGVVEATFDGIATNMSVISPADGNVQLGYSGPRVTGYFDGLIGEVRVYNRHLSATEVIQNYNSTKERYGVITDGLVLHLDAGNPASYPGIENTWYDLSGQGNHGTLYGPTFDSNFGGFLDFDGTNDYVQIADAASLKPENLTLIFIAHTDDVSKGYQMVIEKSQGPPFYNYTLRFDGATGYIGRIKTHLFTPGTPSGTHTYSTTTAVNNAWYFAAATYDGANQRVYVNGVLENTLADTGAMAYDTNVLYLGRRNDGYYLDGGIGVVMIYNRALSDAEILQNYNVFKSRYGL